MLSRTGAWMSSSRRCRACWCRLSVKSGRPCLRHRVLVRLPGVLPRAQRPVLVAGVDPEVPVDRVLLDFLVGTGARYGEAAGLHGCAALAIDRALDPRAVDALLRG